MCSIVVELSSVGLHWAMVKHTCTYTNPCCPGGIQESFSVYPTNILYRPLETLLQTFQYSSKSSWSINQPITEDQLQPQE